MSSNGHKIHLLFGAIAAISFFAMAGVYAAGLYVPRANQACLSSIHVLTTLDEALSTLESAEADQRGFLVTGNDLYLQHYNTSRTQLPNDLRELNFWAQQAHAPPDQIDALSRLAQTRLAELDRTIPLRRTEGPDAALAVLRADAGGPTLGDLRGRFAAFRLLILDEYAQRQQLRNNAIMFGAVASLLAGVITLASIYWAFRKIRHAMAATEEQRQLVQAGEERLRFALDAMHAGAWELDAATHAVQRTLPYDHIFGYENPPPNWTVEKFLDHIVPEDRERAIRAFKDSTRIGNPSEVECRIRRVDGAIRWIWVFGQWRRDSNGKPVRAYGITLDITDHKNAELTLCKTEERFRLFMDNNPAITWIKDEHGRYVFINKTYEQHFGVRSADYQGKTDEELWPPEIAATLRRNDQAALQSGHPIQVSEETVTPTGQRFWFLNSKFPFQDATGNHFIAGIGLDITGRKQAEQAIAQAAEDLRRSNEDLERFAYAASHDLQEPLRMVTSYLHLLEQRYKDQLDQNARDFINFAVDGASRMSQLITDLLEFSRLTTTGSSPTPVPLENVLQRAEENLRVAIAESNAEIIHHPLPTVNGDAAQLVMLFQNLLSNALKFHAPDRPPCVTVSAEKSNGRWQVAVADNGIGLDPKHADKIFLIFKRLHSQSRYPGTGIGLALCKKIVERHGGQIWVHSQPGHGSTFYFTLPPA